MPFDLKSFWFLFITLILVLSAYAAGMHYLGVPLPVAMIGGVIIGLMWPTPKFKVQR